MLGVEAVNNNNINNNTTSIATASMSIYVQNIIPEQLHCNHSYPLITQHTQEIVFPDMNACRNQIWSHVFITVVRTNIGITLLENFVLFCFCC